MAKIYDSAHSCRFIIRKCEKQNTWDRKVNQVRLQLFHLSTFWNFSSFEEPWGDKNLKKVSFSSSKFYSTFQICFFMEKIYLWIHLIHFYNPQSLKKLINVVFLSTRKSFSGHFFDGVLYDTHQSLYYLHTFAFYRFFLRNTKTLQWLTCLWELSEVFVTKCLQIKWEKKEH
jgi:hypothetical protein